MLEITKNTVELLYKVQTQSKLKEVQVCLTFNKS